jgi:uncharacterized OB-fold protein
MQEKRSDIIQVEGLPFGAGFNWSVGVPMERFIKALARKEILGVKCPECGYTYVPPRSRCRKCTAEVGQENEVILEGKGRLTGYTLAYVQLDGSGNFKDLEQPVIIGAVRLEGADSTLFMPIEGILPEEVEEGMGVEVRWREKTKGELADIEAFQPVP